MKVNKDFIPPEDTITSEEDNSSNQFGSDVQDIEAKTIDREVLASGWNKHSFKPLPNIDREIEAMSTTIFDNRWHNFLKKFFIATIVAIVILCIAFLYLLGNGYLTPIINQNYSFSPQVDVPIDNKMTNNYEFNPETTNKYNYTIINEINCPNVSCSC